MQANPDCYFLSCLAELKIQAILRRGHIALAPKELITPKILQVIKQNREAIIDELLRVEESRMAGEANLGPVPGKLRREPWQSEHSWDDPRPDLEEDSAVWTRLLVEAEKVDGMLAGTLHGFRGVGVRLRRIVTGWTLWWTGEGWWKTQEDWKEDKAKWFGDGVLLKQALWGVPNELAGFVR